MLIVSFWLGTLGWFGYREVWPRLFPGRAPPFVIELADEATIQGQTFWTIYREDQEIGKAKTSLRYLNAEDNFELVCEMKDVELYDNIYIGNMTNRYVVTRAKELRSMSTHGELRVESQRRPERRIPGSAIFTVTANFEGHVEDGKLLRSAKITIPFMGDIVPKLEPIDAPTGNVLNPMHPVPRVAGLHPGRRWRMPIFNPVGDAVSPTLQAAAQQAKFSSKSNAMPVPTGPAYLDAEVLSKPETIKWNGRDQECYVIDYRSSGKEHAARTYVRVHDGLVIRQEAYALGDRDRFIMQRD
ncbi:MAG TPA: hypothetical protein VKS79_10050 [Gemmataceae bacterium]|nr:hypothetical protein [Gemmataceae bacterium]